MSENMIRQLSLSDSVLKNLRIFRVLRIDSPIIPAPRLIKVTIKDRIIDELNIVFSQN
ncbi:hypothetical protein [Nostoc piscinale]|uniref:hypothetical protein n=1 Tax=Nostoc piscinale TaxID=224012 RepID=UPI001F4708E0|nr:hypothetical protein [Nostoc piscinale]